MKLGYLTRFSRDEAKLASELGFQALEVHAASWQLEKINSKTKLEAAVGKTKDILEEHNLVFTAIANYDTRVLSRPVKSAVAQFRRVIEFTAALGVHIVTAMAGRLRDKPIDDSIKQFKKVFGEVSKIASSNGVRIAFENWPGMGGYPVSGCNIAYCPAYWDKMFDAVPRDSLGLEFDPSHLYWLGIDYLEAAGLYADRIYHVHAKDTEILYGARNRFGIYEQHWWRYRIPGFGEVDWHAFISTLYESGYNGGVAIEHEDPVFSGESRAEGLRLGLNFLTPILPR